MATEQRAIKLIYTSMVDISIGDGPGVNEREFIEALSQIEEVEARFVIPKPRYPEKSSGIKGIKNFYAGKGHLRFIISQITQPWKLFQELRKGEIDGIIVRSHLIPLTFTFLICSFSIPVFIKTQEDPTINWLCLQPGFKGIISKCIRPVSIWLHKKLFRRASTIDCCTPQLVQSVQALLPENERYKVIHIDNATNPERFYPMDQKVCRNQLGMESFYPIIGYVGGHPTERGGEHILQAVAKLQDQYPYIAGCVVGGTEQEAQELRNLAEKLRIEKRCIIPGRVDYDEVVYWINSFDIGVAIPLSWRLEKIGNSNQKIRQYLSCGLPIVTGDRGLSFIEEYNLGKIVDVRSLNEFVDAIRDLLAFTTGHKEEIAFNAREICKREFSIDAAVQKRLAYWKMYLNMKN